MKVKARRHGRKATEEAHSRQAPPSRGALRSPLSAAESAAFPIENRILLFRGQRVLLDSDLAALYRVPTKTLNRAVKRNRERFPGDFRFRLTATEFRSLRCQFGTSNDGRASWMEMSRPKAGRGGRRYLPYVFTEHGAVMAAHVLRSRRAVKASILVVRAFVRLRRAVAVHWEVTVKLADLERRLDTHDREIREIMAVIRRLIELPDEEPPRERIGFR